MPRVVLGAEPSAQTEGLPQALELGAKEMTRIAPTVWVKRLAPGLWMHTTTTLIDGGFYYPANGLILERQDGALMIDTGSRPDHAETLLAWSRETLAKPITQAVATHFHVDRTGGIPGLQHHRIPTEAYPMTCDLARKTGFPVPVPIKGIQDGVYRLGPDCELFFPGPGHTRDNVVAWLPRQTTLFGGCFLKSITSNGLGNLNDADVGAWAESVRNTAARYPTAKIVVPGHGTIEGDPVKRTLALIEVVTAAPSATDAVRGSR